MKPTLSPSAGWDAQIARAVAALAAGPVGEQGRAVTRATKPKRVLMLGWADLRREGEEGGGYNLATATLAAGLAMQGHHVYYLRSGMSYSLRPGMTVRPESIWRGIGCFAFVNSPNLAPANFNFSNVLDQISSPSQTGAVMDFVDQLRPDVVHVHSLEGLPLDLIPAIRKSGVPVVVTPHNYYAVCPQVDLMHNEALLCTDYEGGAKCARCIDTPNPGVNRRTRRIQQTVRSLMGPGTLTHLTVLGRSLRRAAAGLSTPVKPLEAGQATSPTDWEAMIKPMPSSPVDITATLLANAAAHGVVSTEYGRRRAAGIASLNAASMVLCPSQIVLEVHKAMGVRADRLRMLHLGQPHFEHVAAAAKASAFYDVPPWQPAGATRPLRVAFHGTTKPNKGLDTLTRAIAQQPSAIMGRVQWIIRAQGDIEPFRRRLAHAANVSFAGPFQPSDLAGMTHDFDVGIFPNLGLENSPFVLLEYLHAGRFVIASNLGAPPYWIQPGLTGALCPAGHPGAVLEAVMAILDGHQRLPSARTVHATLPDHTFQTYLNRVNDAYDQCAESDGSPSPHTRSTRSAAALLSPAAP